MNMSEVVCSAVAAAGIPVTEWWSLQPFNSIFVIWINAAQLKSKSWLTPSWERTHSPRTGMHHSKFPKNLILS